VVTSLTPSDHALWPIPKKGSGRVDVPRAGMDRKPWALAEISAVYPNADIAAGRTTVSPSTHRATA
jgi:hypothetical protein